MKNLLRLNESDFEELFFDMGALQEVFDKREEKLQTDFGVSPSGLGRLDLDFQKKGAVHIVNTKCLFHENVLVKGDTVESIALYFIKKGGGLYDFSFNREERLNPNSYNVLFGRDRVKSSGLYKKHSEEFATRLHFSYNHFKQMTEDYPDLFAEYFMRYDRGESFYLNKKYRPTTIQMQEILWQLENSHLMGNCETLYANAKFMELMSVLFANSNLNKEELCRNQADYDKMQEAAYLLLLDIHNPPSIKSLSLQVGVNEKKLKQGFKEVFGTTVYGYLFEHKMQLAVQLLRNTNQTTSEIALQCGYEYPSHFCTAFKRKFGVSPLNKRNSPKF